MKRYTMIALFFWTGLGVFILIHSYGLGLGKLSSPGPGLMPFLVGALLVLFSLVAVWRRWSHKTPVQPGEEVSKGRADLSKVALVLGCLLAYAFFLERLGYLVTSFLMLTLLFRAMGSKRWSMAVTTSLLTVLVTYFAFTYLGLVFPSGIVQWEWVPG